MKEWMRLFERGKRELSKHNTQNALQEFQKALEICPVENREDITKILFYTGISLNKLGFGGLAVRTWTAASRLKKGGPCSAMVDRMTNEFGMVRQDDEEDCDFRAFHAIHLSRYLLSRGSRKFGSLAEKDVVEDVIKAAWENLLENVSLEDLSPGGKLNVFRRQVVVFPYLECPESWEYNEIIFDFRNNSRVSGDSQCFCGSGRDNMTCCGRIPSEDELEIGHF